MHAAGRFATTRQRAVAILLIGVLGLTFGSAARTAHAHHHLSHTAVLAVSTTDTLHSTPRTEQHGVAPAGPGLVTPPASHADTSDSSTPISARTAQAPQVRGPPAQSLA